MRGFAEDRQLSVGLETVKDFLGFQHACDGPAQRHLSASPALGVTASIQVNRRAQRAKTDTIDANGIIALARKLLVTLWRYLETGLIPTDAALKA